MGIQSLIPFLFVSLISSSTLAFFGESFCHLGDFSNQVDFQSDLSDVLKDEVMCSPTFDFTSCGKQLFDHEYRPIILCQSGARFSDTKSLAHWGSASKSQKRAMALRVAEAALKNAGLVPFSKSYDVSFFYNPNNSASLVADDLAVFFHYSKWVKKGWINKYMTYPWLFDQEKIQRVKAYDFEMGGFEVVYEELAEQEWHLPVSGSGFLHESVLLKRK